MRTEKDFKSQSTKVFFSPERRRSKNMRIYWFLPIKKGNGKTFRASYRKPRDPFLPAERMLFVKFLLPRRDQEKEVLSQHIQVETEKTSTDGKCVTFMCMLVGTYKQRAKGRRQ